MEDRLCYAIIAQSHHVKVIKTHLESLDLMQRNVPIHTYPGNCLGEGLEALAVPTTLPADGGETEAGQLLDRAHGVRFMDKDLQFPQTLISLVRVGVVELSAAPARRRANANPFQRAVLMWLNGPPRPYTSDTTPRINDLLTTVPKAFNVYPPMLLLPSNSFDGEAWKAAWENLTQHPEKQYSFLQSIAESMGVTHIAMNAPIPANLEDNVCAENIIRSPVHLEPLFGDLGPNLPPFPQHRPDEDDFKQAFWVSTRQNGIIQAWAPRYTMFSAGNVTEKARVLAFPDLKDAAGQDRRECAVDLFSGIGYFAFSYARAGVSQVLCWDLNPWSIEGFRRGAVANKWSCQIFGENSDSPSARSPSQFLVFSESNVKARKRLHDMRAFVPPIRHVNCGTLPTIGKAWEIAIEAIDPVQGGWIHIHETMAERSVTQLQEQYTRLVQAHYDNICVRSGPTRDIKLEHVERVKSMGPKLWHIVLDFWIPPQGALHSLGA